MPEQHHRLHGSLPESRPGLARTVLLRPHSAAAHELALAASRYSPRHGGEQLQVTPLCGVSSHRRDALSFRAMRRASQPLTWSGAPCGALAHATTDHARGAFPLAGHALLIPAASATYAVEGAQRRVARGDGAKAEARAIAATRKRARDACVLARFTDALVMWPAFMALADPGAALCLAFAALADMAADKARGLDGRGRSRRRQPDPDRGESAQDIAARRNAAEGACQGHRLLLVHGRLPPFHREGPTSYAAAGRRRASSVDTAPCSEFQGRKLPRGAHGASRRGIRKDRLRGPLRWLIGVVVTGCRGVRENDSPTP
jgi:hypothetical protein